MSLLSKIYTLLAKDTALTLDANFDGVDIVDRRYIDNQIQGVEQHLIDSLISSKLASWFRARSSLAVGDVCCAAGVLSIDAFQSVTLALPGDLVNSAQAIGVVLKAANANEFVLVATSGTIPAIVTQLAALSGNVRVSSTGRCERVAAFGATDFQLGVVDAAGVLTLAPSRLGTVAGPVGVVWGATKTNTAVIGSAERAVGTDTTGGRWTLFLPALPTANEDHVISDVAGAWDTNPLTIHGNGVNILGAASYTATGRWNSLWFSYNSFANIWVVI